MEMIGKKVSYEALRLGQYTEKLRDLVCFG